MSALRLLVIEGNTRAARERSVASGGTVASESYAELLRSLSPAGTITAGVAFGRPYQAPFSVR